MTTPYQSGAAAQRRGQPVTDCFPRGAAEKQYRIDWLNGWYDSMFGDKYGAPWLANLRKNGVEP